jgi:F0F1-type ATP synthase assembly protein I
MTSSIFTPPPVGSDSAQHLEWTRRQDVAECILAALAAEGHRCDSPIIACLQPYVSGHLTLGQALGRVIDHLARTTPWPKQRAPG